jgi:hypothetical protein
MQTNQRNNWNKKIKKQRHLYVVPVYQKNTQNKLILTCKKYINQISFKTLICYLLLTIFVFIFNVTNQNLYEYHGITLWLNLSLSVFTLVFGVPWIILGIPEALYFNTSYTFIVAFLLNCYYTHKYLRGEYVSLPYLPMNILNKIISFFQKRRSKSQQNIKLSTNTTQSMSELNHKVRLKPTKILPNRKPKIKHKPDSVKQAKNRKTKKDSYLLQTKNHIIKLKNVIHSTWSRR